jgi:outer membrane protein OmpA-like peptidoglycan-associated protein
MKKQYAALVLLLVVGMAGCGKKKKKTDLKSPKSDVYTELDIPVAGNDSADFFDENVAGFNLADDLQVAQAAVQDEYSWVDDTKRDGFPVVYFDFDSTTIRVDQEEILKQDIALALKKYQDNNGITIVVDGHACHSAGSHAYNLALSEKRAKVLADRLVAAGVPSENIKIVGRGMEMPAMVDGKPVDGDRQQQWPNRRDEIHVIYS